MEHSNNIFDHRGLILWDIEPDIQRVNESPSNTFRGKSQDVVVGRISDLDISVDDHVVRIQG